MYPVLSGFVIYLQDSTIEIVASARLEARKLAEIAHSISSYCEFPIKLTMNDIDYFWKNYGLSITDLD